MTATQTLPIALHTWTTPNGRKIAIMLEELGVPYELHMVNINRGDQFTPEFTAISPNNRIPAIVDPEGPGGEPISIFESGAILKYLAEKYSRFYPDDWRARVLVDQWLFWQVGGVGPMIGQNHHFTTYAAGKDTYASTRFQDETHRLYGVLDTRLREREWVAGDYSIADIAILPWTENWKRQLIQIDEFPEVKAWRERLHARPAVVRGLAAGRDRAAEIKLESDPAAQAILFGQRARR
ncbi:MAG: glutathione S-transferase N-terminal domain-containing protein [Cucumibacter sp.]